MKKILLLALMTPVLGLAQESIQCKIEKQKTEVQAIGLESPQAFANLGDSASNSKSLIAGVSQSYNGRKRAQALRRAADLKCEAQQAVEDLKAVYSDSKLIVDLNAAKRELALTEKAILKADEVVNQIQLQLKHQEATITQLNDALQAKFGLIAAKANLERQLSQMPPVLNTSEEASNTLLSKAIYAQSLAAETEANALSDAGWDVVMSVGAKRTLDTGVSSGFVAVSLKYSFGLSKSEQAASELASLIRKHNQEDETGLTKVLAKEKNSLVASLYAEQQAERGMKDEISQIDQIIASLSEVKSGLASTTKNVILLRKYAIEAKLSNCLDKIQGYSQILERLK